MRVAGAILILLGCSGTGVLFRKELQNRLKTLKNLHLVVQLRKSESEFQKKPVYEVCGSIASRTPQPLRKALERIAQRMQENKGERFETIFINYTREPLKAMALKDEDLEIFYSFLATSGYTDLSQQLKLLDRCEYMLLEKIKVLTLENPGKSRMALGLGVLSGLLVLLMLS